VNDNITGSCLCGQVRYEIFAEMGAITHCHCPSCQKAHAAAFSSVTSVPLDGLKFVAGKELLKYYESSAGKKRYFCSHCGSQIYAKRDDQNHYILRMGTIDGDPGIRPIQHIFTSYKAPWYNIHDDIAEFSGWPEKDASKRSCLSKKYRPLFEDVRFALHQAARKGTVTSLLLLEISATDKESNSGFHHKVNIQSQIRKNIRDSDTIIVLDGMYAVLLPYTNSGAAIILVERIRNTMKGIGQQRDRDLQAEAGFYIGVASLHPDHMSRSDEDIDLLITTAEKTLHAQKVDR